MNDSNKGSNGPAGSRSGKLQSLAFLLSAGRARDHPVMEIVPNKALSLSLSLSVDKSLFLIKKALSLYEQSKGGGW